MFDTMGNIAISTHTKMRDGISNPKIEPMIGTRARIGIACMATRYGQIERSSQRACDMMIANDIPSTMAMARPISATLAVQ